MRDFVIITDGCCDLPQHIIEELGVRMAPLGLTIGNQLYKHYYDFRELSKDNFYDNIRNGIVGMTSGVNVQDAMTTMREVLEQDKDVLYLSFSSAMSVSYQSSVLAAKELQEEFPEANIKVIDTLSACIGQGLLIYLAAQKKAEGLSLDAVSQFVEDNKLKIFHCFMVDNLKYLQKSGRISHLTAIAGTMMNIKPVFNIGNDGKIFNDGKVRGKVAGKKYLLNKLVENCTNFNTILIGHADDEEAAKELKNEILEIHPDTNVIVSCIGPIIGNCLGPSSLAVTFMSEKR